MPQGTATTGDGPFPAKGLARVPRLLRKRLHLSGGHLAGCNAFRLQKRPELPFLTASRLKADDGIPVPGEGRYPPRLQRLLIMKPGEFLSTTNEI